MVDSQKVCQMTEECDNSEGWETCAGGEISRMLQGIQNRQRRVFALQLAGGALAAVLVGVFFVEFRPAGNVNAAEITCRDVRKAAKDYLAGRVSADEKGRIAAHLDDCPHCAEWMRKMRNKSGDGTRIESQSPRTVAAEPAATEAPALVAQISSERL